MVVDAKDMKGSKEPEPMAIVGMGCRWAGGVRDVRGLWEFLTSKRSGYQDWAAPRFSAAGFYHPNPERPGTTAAKGGYVVSEDPRLFDPSFFGISGLEAETIDASQRKLLEVVYEAFESAGDSWESVNGTRTGVYVADISYDASYAQTRDWEYARPHATTGTCHNILSNRINYVFNLRGPSVTLDSACTSALYGLHMAIQAIRDGDCDSAIVASSNWIMDPSMQIAMDKLGALSATSMSRAFDASADGYARGEGFAAIYLKKPEKAMQDGSPIRALVRGSAIGANGRSSGITHPSGAAQEEIIRKAYENAGGLPPSDTPFLECHGTGTRVGDPLEVEAAGKVFGPGRSDGDFLLIGSVKTNLGHTEGAAALAGIFKAVLALEAGAIPPSLGVKTLNPRINFEKAKAKVVTEVIPWPEGKPRRASVTSAGFGGSIGHCILDHVNEVYPDYVKPGILDKVKRNSSLANDSAQNGNGATYTNSTNGFIHLNGHNHANGAAHGPENGHQNGPTISGHLPVVRTPKKTGKADASTRQLVLLPFSAHNKSSLQANISALSHVIDQHSLADVAYTLAVRRSKLTQRTFYIVDKDSVTDGLLGDVQRVSSSPSEAPRLGFVFTGQGAQWHAMGAQLFEYRVFRSAIEHLDYVLGTFSRAPSWTIADILCGNCSVDRIETPEISQTVCTAIQIGLVDLLASWSVYPSGVVGHSSGEIAAAYAAGRITAAESIATAYFRGQTVSQNKQKGAMLAVGLGLEQVEEYLVGLEQDVKVAAINSPGSVTLSGKQGAVERLSKTLDQEGVFNRLLKTGGNAYHSWHMVALGQEYDTLLSDGLAHLDRLGLRDERHRYPRIPWASSVTPDKSMLAESALPSYWRANLESPVRFSDAAANLVGREDLEIGALVEIGPHFALKSPLDQILKSIGKNVPYAGSLKRGEDGRTSMLQLAGTLFSLNAKIDLAAVNATDERTGAEWTLAHGVTAIDLPPYQYTYGPISYYESRASKEFRLRRVPRHDLLGSKVAGNAKLRPQFRNVLRLKDLPWLADHRLLPDAVFPAAGYISMAIVAASQVYEEFPDAHPVEGYSLRNVDIKTALKIPEDQHGIEIILSMELVDTATARAPAWTSFSISSIARDSEKWTEHCTGLIKPDVFAGPLKVDKISTTAESRAVNARNWYRKFAAIGLGYGPTFQALSEIRADPAKNLASAKLGLKTTAGTVKGGESAYLIHPASLDAMIQLGLLACYGGQTESATTAFVPIHLSQLHVRAGSGQDWGLAAAHGEFRGLRSAYLQLQLQSQTGDVLLDIKDLRCISYSLEDQPLVSSRTKAFASPFTRMVYKPDFRALSNRQAHVLFPPPTENVAQVPVLNTLETIAALIAVDVYESVIASDSNESNAPEKTRHYIAWIRRLLPAPRRRQILQGLYRETGHLVETKALQRLHENMADIGGILADFFTDSLFLTGAQPQVIKLFDSLKGGRGDTARLVLETLSSANGIKRYRDYTVTDASEAALKLAREHLTAHRDQGYQPVYDVVLASQAVHTASSIGKALENARKLLRPGGKLVLVEATGSSAWVGLIGGAQPGYWHGLPDGRIDSPFLNVAEWDKALHSAGFSGAELTLDDYPGPTTHSTVLVSTLVEEQRGINTAGAQVVWLLHSAKGAPALLNQLARELEHRGLLVKTVPLDNSLEEVPANARVIAFLDGENLLLDVDQRRLDIFQHLAHHTASMVWLTSTGMAQGRSPDGAIVGGLLRIISTEAPTGRFVSIDIDADDFNIAGEDDLSELVRVVTDQEQALQRVGDDGNNEDREFAWHSGCLWVSRLVPEAALHGYAERLITPATHGAELLPLDTHGPVRAAFETPGILSSLYFRPYTELLQQPLPHDWIEVKVAAVGLNWKDVALSTGRFDANNLSSEYAGVVTRVGADAASRFDVGDAVYGLGKGHFGNYARVPAAFAQKAGPGDDLVGLATLPVVLMTAVYAFEHLTHLRRGQKVLIQSASGGLGLGAIQLARAKGADVFAMAGSQDKVRFLVEEVGLPGSHVFMGRDTAALSRAVTATSNNGFDVILSTAQGDMLYETAKALAPLGHLIDVGRLDVMDARVIGLELFQKGASFSSFDLVRVVDRDAELGEQLMQAVGEHYRAGRIAPIRPLAVSDISQLDQTLLSFSRGTHLGKLVVTFNPNSPVRMVAAPPAASFDPEACYIITGGLSGLGRSIIQWMGDRGARDLVVLSRRGASAPEAQTLVDAMAERGVRLHPVACDLSSREQVVGAIEQASARRPVKGVVHCAVSYRDISFNKLSLEGWRDGLAAKVLGTQNLHEATKAFPLDFFVMTTSALSVLGFATQGAYTAANNFQDQFARYRRRLGLPATAAQFGLINDVGHLSTDNVALDMMARNKVLTVPESYFLRLLEPAFLGLENAKAATQCTGATADPLAGATYVTCMDPAHMAAKEREDAEMGLPSAAPPRWHSDSRVSHVMQALDDALRHAASGGDVPGAGSQGDDGRSAIGRLRRDFDEAVQQTRASPAGTEQVEQRARAVELVTAALKTTIAGMLLMDESTVNAARAVSDHGVDSLIATEFRNWLLLALGAKISMVDLLDPRTTINALAAKVVDAAVGTQE
ncbi:polyketide synthase [Mytilinidion resinicola]|uniref:Polyketide synthase n=1 Tax=Mytilinidion resinicola TaxID=574789 RepID=A0A6A6YB23_9PEZI|nr:polyketide synthase [Mytilinidion resinicola]KAF2806012.1 polyketide synthase [Mytilinidion resinicola]